MSELQELRAEVHALKAESRALRYYVIALHHLLRQMEPEKASLERRQIDRNAQLFAETFMPDDTELFLSNIRALCGAETDKSGLWSLVEAHMREDWRKP
jgi:hypothetical protein